MKLQEMEVREAYGILFQKMSGTLLSLVFGWVKVWLSRVGLAGPVWSG
jgi:hypothetical protein